MESKTSKDDDFLDSLEIPDDGLAYLDVDKLDPSTVYRDEEDKRYLESLSELQREAIIAERLDKLKKVTEMKRALSRANSQSSEGLSRADSRLSEDLFRAESQSSAGANEKIYVPPFLRAPDHHLWPYFKNSPDEKTSELATDEAIDEGIEVDGNTTVGHVATTDGIVLKSVRETLPDLSTEPVPDKFLNPVDDKLSGFGNEVLDEDVQKPYVENETSNLMVSRRTSPPRSTSSNEVPVGTGELAPKVNYNNLAEIAAAASRRTSPRRSPSSKIAAAASRRTSPRRSSTVDNETVITGSKAPKRRYQKRNVKGKDAVIGEGGANTNIAPKRKYQRKKSSEVKSSDGNAVPKRKYQKKDGKGKQSSPRAEPAITTDAEVSKSEGVVSEKILNNSEQELKEPDFFAYPNDSFSISGDDDKLPTNANNNLVNTAASQGRGKRKHSTTKGRGKSGVKVPQPPVALKQQQGWRVLDLDQFEDAVDFEFQHVIVDKLLSHRAAKYASHLTKTVRQKLQLHSLELTEVNIFMLLLSNALDSIMEYTNEALNSCGLFPLSHVEFRCFLGTLLLSSAFNASVTKVWEMMNNLTAGKSMVRERFVQILNNLRGYPLQSRIIEDASSTWTNQRNQLDQMHTLEKKIFERSVELFFDTRYGGYVLDDELIASKADDVEHKILSDRKSGGEGPTCDCICDSYFQFVLAMRVRSTGDSQIYNVEKLLDTLPPIDNNELSNLGPILACDRGYGKKSAVELFASKNYKVIAIANALGSEHPFVSYSTVNAYTKKIREHNVLKKTTASDSDEDSFSGVLETNIQTFEDTIAPYALSDDQDTLLGPEVRVAQHSATPSLYAYVYRDIFDKKIAQKLLRFFVYGFPNVESMLRSWVIVPKRNDKITFDRLYYYYANKPTVIQDAETYFNDRAQPLTHAQRTAEWFILRAFHLTATMASRIINSANPMEGTTILEMLLSSWFTRTRSTTEMVIGTTNENAILAAFHRNNYVLHLFECGLFECLQYPWLAASPDAIAVLRTSTGNFLATVEVKTRVSLERISIAERIAEKHQHKRIFCTIGDDVWNEVVDKDHSIQIMVQLSVMKLSYCVYLVGQAGTRGASGRILYTVIGRCTVDYMATFITTVRDQFEGILLPFFKSESTRDLLEKLPEDLSYKSKQIIESRWIFFHDMRKHLLNKDCTAFPATSVFKTELQTMYNSLKGGLDANTQQFSSICPQLKTKFEQKYIVRLLLAVVTNAWRTFQLLNHEVEVDNFSLHLFRKSLINHCPSLRDFNYNLAMGLIQSMSNPYFQNVLFSETNRSSATEGTSTLAAVSIGTSVGEPVELGFQREPETLAGRLQKERWPVRYKAKVFTKNKTFLELRLTENEQFLHSLTAHGNKKKKHCALCLMGRTKFWCATCQVPLCRTAKCSTHKHNSCYSVWHSTRDLVDAARQVRLDMRLKLDRKKRANLERGAIDDSSSSDNSTTSEGESNNSPSRDRKVSGKAQKKQNTEKEPQPEQDSLDEDRSSNTSTTTERASNSSPKKDSRVSGRTTIGPLDLIAHCANNSYRRMTMKENAEDLEGEVEDEYCHTSFSNNSEGDKDSTDTEDHDVTEV